ncbi:Putative choline kinase [Psilocybe cubensis]|uniref:Choline kinase n=2 Tax=Psilocybe cubensis TaxID=181762 RepID=A0ACB8HGY2_PSICU|nr:Putative choline kinase [Psilocybe cubensis]KAH9487096.1 Putative choline kinase [Psilocybe cubensis]
MTPILSPGFSSSSSPLPPAGTSRQVSTSSLQTLADLLVSASTAQLSEANVEVVREEGVRHAKFKLDARHYKKSSFCLQVIEILRKLHVPGWYTAQILPEDVIIHKVSGALTNAVFFVSCPAIPSLKTLLLRVYGPSSGSLISRPRELHILHVLSSQYKIGPRVYGTFDNGRIEEYFNSVTLTPEDIRDPQTSQWIGARMAELHSVDIETVYGPTTPSLSQSNGFEIAANVSSWLGPAQDVLELPSVTSETVQELGLEDFKKEWDRYLSWVLQRPHTFGTRRVFAHNDAQYGNLLRLKDGNEGVDEHRQIIVVDFEYAAPNPAAYDIANHFIEWTANYHCSTPHLLTPSRYPTFEERSNFYAAYIHHAGMLAEDPVQDDAQLEKMIQDLDRDVLIWAAASHAGWAIWGIVQAREDIEAAVAEPEFDYIGYAKGRMAAFRADLRQLGI